MCDINEPDIAYIGENRMGIGVVIDLSHIYRIIVTERRSAMGGRRDAVFDALLRRVFPLLGLAYNMVLGV